MAFPGSALGLNRLLGRRHLEGVIVRLVRDSALAAQPAVGGKVDGSPRWQTRSISVLMFIPRTLRRRRSPSRRRTWRSAERDSRLPPRLGEIPSPWLRGGHPRPWQAVAGGAIWATPRRMCVEARTQTRACSSGSVCTGYACHVCFTSTLTAACAAGFRAEGDGHERGGPPGTSCSSCRFLLNDGPTFIVETEPVGARSPEFAFFWLWGRKKLAKGEGFSRATTDSATANRCETLAF